PRFASSALFLCLIVLHLLCPDMGYLLRTESAADHINRAGPISAEGGRRLLFVFETFPATIGPVDVQERSFDRVRAPLRGASSYPAVPLRAHRHRVPRRGSGAGRLRRLEVRPGPSVGDAAPTP